MSSQLSVGPRRVSKPVAARLGPRQLRAAARWEGSGPSTKTPASQSIRKGAVFRSRRAERRLAALDADSTIDRLMIIEAEDIRRRRAP
jgi:hypothetical protein